MVGGAWGRAEVIVMDGFLSVVLSGAVSGWRAPCGPAIPGVAEMVDSRVGVSEFVRRAHGRVSCIRSRSWVGVAGCEEAGAFGGG